MPPAPTDEVRQPVWRKITSGRPTVPEVDLGIGMPEGVAAAKNPQA